MEKKKVIFISDDLGASTIWNKLGTRKLIEFRDSKNNIEQINGVFQKRGSAIWVGVVDDNTEEDHEALKELRERPEFNKAFFETDSMPIASKVTNLRERHDPNSPQNQEVIKGMVEKAVEDVKTKAEEDKKIFAAKNKRWAVLSAQVQKIGGGIAANAAPELVQEFKNLSIELEYNNEETNS